MKENLIRAVCKEIRVTYRQLENIKSDILEGFLEYHANNLDNLKLTSKEGQEIFKKIKHMNSLSFDDKKDIKEVTRGFLNKEYDIDDCGRVIKLVSPVEIFGPNYIFACRSLNKVKSVEIIEQEVTPKMVKDLLKEYNWTYKDLADNIGAVDTTIRNWMSKGEFPKWATKSILYIITIEELRKRNVLLQKDLDELITSLRTISHFIRPTDT